MPPIETTEETTTTTTTETIAPESKSFSDFERDFNIKEAARLGKKLPEIVEKPAEKKVEPVIEKTVEKVDDKKPEPKPEDKKLSGFQRRIQKVNARAEAAENKNRELEARIIAIEGGKKTVDKVEEKAPEEPKREAYTTVEEWVAAVRKFDKDQTAAEAKKVQEQAGNTEVEKAWGSKLETFNKSIETAKAKHADWDEVRSTTKVQFDPMLQGVLITADAELLYDLAKTPKQARNLNGMEETAIVAAGNSDDVTGVLRWLAAHPEDIDKLNGLNPVKAQAYVGRIEAKIEAAALIAEADKKRSAEGATDTSEEAKKVKAEADRVAAANRTAQAQKDRVRPEPPAKLEGTAPSSATFTDPANMSFAERERLWREDPRNKRR